MARLVLPHRLRRVANLAAAEQHRVDSLGVEGDARLVRPPLQRRERREVSAPRKGVHHRGEGGAGLRCVSWTCRGRALRHGASARVVPRLAAAGGSEVGGKVPLEGLQRKRVVARSVLRRGRAGEALLQGLQRPLRLGGTRARSHVEANHLGRDGPRLRDAARDHAKWQRATPLEREACPRRRRRRTRSRTRRARRRSGRRWPPPTLGSMPAHLGSASERPCACPRLQQHAELPLAEGVVLARRPHVRLDPACGQGPGVQSQGPGSGVSLARRLDPAPARAASGATPIEPTAW